MSITPLRRRFTVDEYECMIATGILKEDERLELLSGEIVAKMPIGSRHQGCVNYLGAVFTPGVAGAAIVHTQGPVRLTPDSEPEPDVMLLRPRLDFYRAANPTPEDVLLLIEVADSSLDHDLLIKLPGYAAAGIAEVWIIDLNGRRLLVFRRPIPDGYHDRVEYQPGATVAPIAFPALTLSVSDILG